MMAVCVSGNAQVSEMESIWHNFTSFFVFFFSRSLVIILYVPDYTSYPQGDGPKMYPLQNSWPWGERAKVRLVVLGPDSLAVIPSSLSRYPSNEPHCHFGEHGEECH